MYRYLAKRLTMTVGVLVLVTIFVGALIPLIPGDPVTAILGSGANPEQVEAVRHELLLDRSFPAQVWAFAGDAVRGDFGVSPITQQSVSSAIAESIPHTIILVFSSLIVALALAAPLAIYSATHPGAFIDRVLSSLSVGLAMLPPYVSGLVLLLVFAVTLQAFPAIGTGDLGDPGGYLHHLVLPVFALAIGYVGFFARVIRINMLEVLSADYVRNATALGLPRRQVLYKYALRNAAVPVVAVVGASLGYLFGGAVFVEIIFSRPGLGSLIYNAIDLRDYPVVRAGLLVVAFLTVGGNLLADLSYGLLDPRIRVRGAGTL